MGAADLVPGISGGTVAFIMGFYHQLLNSIKTINFNTLKLVLSGRWKELSHSLSWKFLLTLFSGIVVSFIIFASFFSFVLGHEIYRAYLYATFLGLILASFVFCMKQVKQWCWLNFFGLLVGALVAYLLTGSSALVQSKGPYAIRIDQSVAGKKRVDNFDVDKQLLYNLNSETLGMLLAKGIVTPKTEVYDNKGKPVGEVAMVVDPYTSYRLDGWLMLCGGLAICALLLPGISGSYLLTLLGVYPIAIGALAELIAGAKQLSFNAEAFFILFNLAIGIVIGLILFSRVISWCLKNYSDMTIAILCGFMIGALRSVWPFWSYHYTLLPLKLEKGPQLVVDSAIIPSDFSLIGMSLLFCVGGFVSVFLIELIAARKEDRQNVLHHF